MRTVCNRCGSRGYIFPDQLDRKTQLSVGDYWYAKCCNGRKRQEKRAECKGLIDSGRAVRLQNIRRRETTIDPNEAVANF